MAKRVKRTRHQPGNDPDDHALAMFLPGPAPGPIEEPAPDEAEQPAADIIEHGRAADAAQRPRQDRRCGKRQHDGRADVGQRERTGDGKAA